MLIWTECSLHTINCEVSPTKLQWMGFQVPTRCHHIISDTLCKAGISLGMGQRHNILCHEVALSNPTYKLLKNKHLEKETIEQRKTEMFVQTLISRCARPLGLCTVCWIVYVRACRMHYGAFRKTCTAHFPLQAPKTSPPVQLNQTVTLTGCAVGKIRALKVTPWSMKRQSLILTSVEFFF